MWRPAATDVFFTLDVVVYYWVMEDYSGRWPRYVFYVHWHAFLVHLLEFGQSPYQVNMMLAGWDKHDGPSLYYLDYISTLHKLEKGGMGYGESSSTTSLRLAFVLYICPPYSNIHHETNEGY